MEFEKKRVWRWGVGGRGKTKKERKARKEKLKLKYENMRIRWRKNKKARVELPKGITHDMLPEYVWYERQVSRDGNKTIRECFRILRHPTYDSNLCYEEWNTQIVKSSNSNKFTPLQKLAQIKQKLYDLENDIDTLYDYEKNDPYLSKCITIRPLYSWWFFWQGYQPHFMFDLSSSNKTFHLKMKIDPDKTINEELERFKKKLWDTFEGVMSKSFIY